MSKIKNILVVLLLVVLTVCTSFLPSFINLKNEQARLSSKEYWRHTAESGLELTASEFAKLYANSAINGSFSVVTLTDKTENLSEEDIKLQTLEILKPFFESDEELFFFIRDIVEAELVHSEKSSILTLIDGKPTAFSFVNTSFTSDMTTISILYEEKTSTVVHFYYSCIFNEEENASLKPLSADAVISSASNYYLNRLNLDKDQYFYAIDSGWSFLGVSTGILKMEKIDEYVNYEKDTE